MTQNKNHFLYINPKLFIGSFLVTFLLILFFVNKTASYFEEYTKQKSSKIYTKNVIKKLDLTTEIGAEILSSQQIKARELFRFANAGGSYFGGNILNNKSAFESLFPGYGEKLRQDKAFWSEYFQLDFSPDSYLDSMEELSNLGFRVSYSWGGCMKIFEKYGADIIVFGSSEVYKALAPGYFAKKLSPAFGGNPKVLICGTPAMNVDAVQWTAQEMSRHKHKPLAILWGYSFWQAYINSNKLKIYSNDKKIEFDNYKVLSGKINKIDDRASNSKKINFGLRDTLPEVSWDLLFYPTWDRYTKINSRTKNQNQESLLLGEGIISGDDDSLKIYLKENLEPFYDINLGISEKDCDMSAPAIELQSTIKALKVLSDNIFIYIPQTTEHHQLTAPRCFIKNVDTMLNKISKLEGINYYSIDNNFGLSNRDFINKNFDSESFIYDINHANYNGGKKIFNKLAIWINKLF